MSTIATVSIPADEFVLNEALETLPDLRVEIIRVVAHEDGRVMPLLLASADRQGRVEEVLNADPTVDDVKLLADLNGEQMFNMDWIDRIDILKHVLVEADGTILDAYAEERQWHLRLLFPERDALSATYDFCRENDLTFTIETVYEMDESPQRGQYGLTEEQYRTLVSASEHGYYDVPREMTMAELASDLGISHQALSERLRRGHGRLVQNALLTLDEGEGAEAK